VFALIALLLALFPATLRPAGDEDLDGYTNLREMIRGCDPLDAASFPVCQWGEVVACSTTEPGFTPPPEPC
jgi:hypothetical protein